MKKGRCCMSKLVMVTRTTTLVLVLALLGFPRAATARPPSEKARRPANFVNTAETKVVAPPAAKNFTTTLEKVPISVTIVKGATTQVVGPQKEIQSAPGEMAVAVTGTEARLESTRGDTKRYVLPVQVHFADAQAQKRSANLIAELTHG